MTNDLADASVLHAELRALGRADGITSVQRLAGGAIAQAWLVSYADGTRVAGKTLAGAPAEVFGVEAEGLTALRVTGPLPTPRVLAVTTRLLLLEALQPRDDSVRSWEGLARGMAALHSGTVHDRFGWHRDGYLGRLPQVNPWTASGHEFFAQHRLLRYLREPAAWQVLTAADRRATERLCDRLSQIVPAMPAVLTHGDLWSGNLLSRDGEIAVIDPAVSFSWAETDLSMLWCSPRPPASQRFFELYQELNPSPAGWAERMPVLHLRELLSTIAHFGDQVPATVAEIRRTLHPFYGRPCAPAAG